MRGGQWSEEKRRRHYYHLLDTFFKETNTKLKIHSCARARAPKPTPYYATLLLLPMTSPLPTTPMNSCTSGSLVRPVLSKSLRYDAKAEARSFTSGAVSREGARGRRKRA